MFFPKPAVLIVVHLLIAAHIVQWVVAGSTVSPVEPSESMQTLELGEINAGFVFFVVAILATLIFGRYFCGWGCHVVALQDLCTWMMNKIGVRPKPFRSRLLVWAPLGFGPLSVGNHHRNQTSVRDPTSEPNFPGRCSVSVL